MLRGKLHLNQKLSLFCMLSQNHLQVLTTNCTHILANFQISERGTNERKKFKKRNIPKFPIHYYTKIAAKTGTHDKIILFFASKRGTVPPKEEQLASMHSFLYMEKQIPHALSYIVSNGC